MARKKQQSQGHLEEQRQATKRARKPEATEGTPVHQLVQRLTGHAPGAVNPQTIKALQRTLGNRVVGRLISPAASTTPPAVQREPFKSASEEQELVGSSPATAKTPAAPGPVPIPYPTNTSPMSQAPAGASKVAIKNKAAVTSKSKLGSSMGDEAGTMKGLPSATNMSIKPGQSKVVLQAPGSPEQESPQPAPAASPPTEEPDET